MSVPQYLIGWWLYLRCESLERYVDSPLHNIQVLCESAHDTNNSLKKNVCANHTIKTLLVCKGLKKQKMSLFSFQSVGYCKIFDFLMTLQLIDIKYNYQLLNVIQHNNSNRSLESKHFLVQTLSDRCWFNSMGAFWGHIVCSVFVMGCILRYLLPYTALVLKS